MVGPLDYSRFMSDAAPVFERLNSQQRRAVSHGGKKDGSEYSAGPLLIVAGAGTGKTDTLAHRVAWLVLQGVDPSRILLLTFTRRAALEMTRRAQDVVNEVLAKARRLGGGQTIAQRLAWAGTFHSIANRLLRQFARQLNIDPAFTVIDRGDAADLMDVARHDLGFSAKDKRFPKKDTCLAIYSHRVNTQKPLKATLEGYYPWCLEWEADLTALYREYVGRKQKNAALDYDDLLLYWHIMMSDKQLAAAVGAQFQHVLVDEYQDTNTLQGDILLALKPQGTGVTVVGDDAQAIYSFRAAAVENILGFADKFTPRAETVTLAQNYRSNQPILDAANALIAEGTRQHKKTLFSQRSSAHKPLYVTVEDLHAQAEYVASRIVTARENGVALRRQAVLFRSSHHSDLLEVELMKRKVPFVKYGGLKFLEAAHVKDALSVLRWAENPRNQIAAFRVLQLLPGMGPAHARACIDFLAGRQNAVKSLAEFTPPTATIEAWRPFVRLMEFLADPSIPWPGQTQRVREWFVPHIDRLYDGARTRAADIEQLDRLSTHYPSRERFLTELALDPPAATGDLAGVPLLDEDYVVLSTVHSAKGQEWDSVHVLNVNDGSFPSEFSTGKPELIEEERRLLYVAMTRARNELSLVCPLKYHVTQQPKNGDKHVYGARSRFLTERVLKCFAPTTYQGSPSAERLAAEAGQTLDIASKLKEMW
jgi:DNA helicase-2/ATP-dependent DNA helicase PcrA